MMNSNQFADTNDNTAPVELDAAELEMVTGGINPQPLPPRSDPELQRA
jgi:hypothetical protein